MQTLGQCLRSGFAGGCPSDARRFLVPVSSRFRLFGRPHSSFLVAPPGRLAVRDATTRVRSAGLGRLAGGWTWGWAVVWATVLIQGTLPPARAGERDGPALESLPAGVDLRPKFAAWNLPWRSQGGRGTCSVFALVGGLEYAVARSRGEGRVLSVEFLNWASNRAIRHDADGGFFSDLWKGFERYGVCGEADLPYRAAFDAGLEPPAEIRGQARGWVNQGWGLHWIKRWDVTTGVTGDQFLAIKRTLASEWPVAGGLRWPKEERWEGHVLQMAPPEGVFDGHSVLLVGYRNDPRQPGGGVFLIRNSNRDDPEGALSYEYVRAYLNDAVWVEPPAPGVGGPPR